LKERRADRRTPSRQSAHQIRAAPYGSVGGRVSATAGKDGEAAESRRRYAPAGRTPAPSTARQSHRRREPAVAAVVGDDLQAVPWRSASAPAIRHARGMRPCRRRFIVGRTPLVAGPVAVRTRCVVQRPDAGHLPGHFPNALQLLLEKGSAMGPLLTDVGANPVPAIRAAMRTVTDHMAPQVVFVAGGTGYLGGRLIPLLLARGHRVRALARRGSESRVPPGAEVVAGDPFDSHDLCGCRLPGRYVRAAGGRAASVPGEGAAVLSRSICAPRPNRSPRLATRASPTSCMSAWRSPHRSCTRIRRRELKPSAFWYRQLSLTPSSGPGMCSVLDTAGRTRCCRRTGCSSGCRQQARPRAVSASSRFDQMVAALVAAVENPAAARLIEVPEIRTLHTRINTP